MALTIARTAAAACAPENVLPPAALRHADATPYEIRFANLFREGSALAFPCDSRGCVDLDGLTDRARNNYLFARAMVGRDFATPVVLSRAH
jgi:hypothetical protein